MSFNYPMFVHNRVPSHNSVFHSNFRPHTISVRSNGNQDPDYSRYTSHNDFNSKSLSNRYSMYNYETPPEVILQNKPNFRTKTNENFTTTMSPRVTKKYPKSFNFREKLVHEPKTSKTVTSDNDNNVSKSFDHRLENTDQKKTKVPISFIEYNRNSVCLKRKEIKNNSNLNSQSTESLIKVYSKKQYDNHGVEFNQYHLKTAPVYNSNCENFNAIASKMNSLLDQKNLEFKQFDFNYNKFMYYNRLEDQYSSDNSEDKANDKENMKNCFPRPSSLYYDSGICGDGSNSTYAKGLKRHDDSNFEEKTYTENTIIDRNTNESVKNSKISNKDSSSSLSSDLSSSSNLSSFSSSTTKQRNRMSAMFKSMNLKSSLRVNQNPYRTSLRETPKKIDLPIINLNDPKLSEKKSPSVSQVNSRTETSRADFTPNLFNRVNLLKNGKPIIRNIKVPPLPQINYNNIGIGKSSQNFQCQNIESSNNFSESMMRASMELNKKKPNNFRPCLHPEIENSTNFRNSVGYRSSTGSCSKTLTNSKNNIIKIIDQTNGGEKFKIVSKSEKRCIAVKDFIGLYSENLNLIKGESYVLLSKAEDDWCYVRDKNGNIGCVPGSHLEIITEDSDSKDTENLLHLEKDWFHGNITRSEAYTLLVGNQNFGGTFLVRYNSTEKGKFTLCVYKNGKVYNYKINYEDKQYFIDVKYKFKTLVALIEFYQKNQAGLISNLKFPAEKNFIDKKTLLESLENVYNKFDIDRKDIEFHEKIGSGQFGIVLKAEFKKRKVVAVKKMKPGSKEDELNFNREAQFMMKLQNLQLTQHQNLMQLYGLSKDYDDSILIVTEFVRFGSLYNYLLKNKERILSSKNRFIRLVNICIDVCDGMEYLESQNIIHRDLATRNCLVGEGEVIKVADFGLARFTDDCYIAHPQSQFPVKWSAPEVIKYRSYSSKSDVWSFSCLMYEVFTLGKMPYGGSTSNSVAAKQIISGVIPEKPTFCPNNLYENVITRAWNKNPKDRPSFKELLKLLGNYTCV